MATCRLRQRWWRRAANCSRRRASAPRGAAIGSMWRQVPLDRAPSYSVAPGDAARSRILSWGALAGVVALAAGALVLVFPRSDLLTLLRGETNLANRDLSVAYLRNIIRTEPDDLDLRLLLAEKLLAGGDFAGARQVLDDARALASRTPPGQASWDGWDLAWWQARLRAAQAANEPAQVREAAAELVKRLDRRAGAVRTPAELFAAIQTANTLQAALGPDAGAPYEAARRIARGLPARLLAMPAAGMADLSRGAGLALADGQFQAAADLYFAARRKTAQRDARDNLLRQGVRALLAGGQPLAAWQAAVRESLPLPAGDPLYWWLAELALAAAQPREAAVHLRQVVPLKAGAAALAKDLTAAQRQTAWDTFAAAGDLPAALTVADAALIAQPGDAVWLERKAQVSEWSSQPQQALAAWIELMKRGAGERALANVFRLGPMLFDDDALLAAWQARARQRRLTLDEVRQVVDVYERLGQPDGALAFLRELPTAQPDAGAALRYKWAALEAQLLERAGRPDEAIALLERLRPGGLDRDDAMRLAQLHLRRGDMPTALRALRAALLPDVPGLPGGRLRTDAAGPPAFDNDFWDLVADMAWETGQRGAAEDALDRLLAQGTPEPYQAERAIRLRLDDGRLAQGLALAARLYPRFPVDGVVYAWLEGLNDQPQPTGLDTLLAVLTPDHRARLERSVSFLERRAALQARLGRTALALADYRRALQIQPDSSGTRVAYWWMLLDQQDAPALRAELAARGTRVRRDPAFAEVMAAVWQLLDEPQRALALMQPMARGKANDFLWLMNYADVLERSGREAPALRVRRHAWLLARQVTAQTAQKPADRERARQALITQLRLAAAQAGGDEKSRLWQALGRLVQGSAGDAVRTREANDLVTAWLLAENRFNDAERWLWQQQARRMAVPAYQQMAVAVGQEDTQELARLLDLNDRRGGQQGINRLDPQDRLTALRLLQRRTEAASQGHEQAVRRPEGNNDEAQQLLQEDLLAAASRASVETRVRRAGAIYRREVRADASIAVAPNLRLTLALSGAGDRSTDRAQIFDTPGHDRELRAGIETRTPWGDLKAQWLVRDALATVQGLVLQFTRRLSGQTVLQLEAARNERSDESSAMAVAGARDRLAANLNLRLGDRLEGQASLAANRFRTQSGARLGSSFDGALGGAWYWRRDYPDVRLQVQLRRSTVKADGQPDGPTALLVPGFAPPGVGFFLGPSSTALSASLGVGLIQADPTVYSRAWRPWGEVGFETRRTPTGQQTQGLLRLGAKGAVAGRDQLSINLDVRPGTGGLSGGDGVRELRVRYETFFDR